MSDYNSLYCDLCGLFTKFANINMVHVVNSSVLFQRSLLGETLDPSSSPLEYFTVHLSSTELNYSKTQTVCYHLSFSPALFRHQELCYSFPLHLFLAQAGCELCSCAEAFPAHKEGDGGTGREKQGKAGLDGSKQNCFHYNKKKTTTKTQNPQPNPEPGPQPIFRIRKVLSHFPVSV